MQKINRYIRSASFIYAFSMLSIALVCTYFLLRLIFDTLLGRFDIIFDVKPPHYFHQTYRSFVFGAIIFAPLLETLIKLAAYYLLRLIKWLRKRECYIILIVGVLFGLWHYFSLFHIIAATTAGVFFMYAYAVRRRKGGYWIVVLLHAVWNGLVLLLDRFSAEPTFVF